MTLEFILWIVSWIIVSEGIFIFLRVTEQSFCETWIGDKFLSFAVGGGFILIQFFITGLHYFRLVYELIILGGVGFLFGINKILSDFIERKNNKRRDEMLKKKKKEVK